MKVYNEGDQIILKQGERHRLVGLEDFGIVAEIWQHTEKNQPSDEEDIVRIQMILGDKKNTKKHILGIKSCNFKYYM